MLNSLQLVFGVLRGTKLILKPSKYIFGVPMLHYLGFTISKELIRPEKKVETIASYPSPKNDHEGRLFLGLTGYFRRFIVGYAMLADPLTCLTRRNVHFVWGDVHKEVFRQLKEMLCCESVVRMYNSDAKVTQVHTDTSSVVLSGMLL